jgi:hypothetical protein
VKDSRLVHGYAEDEQGLDDIELSTEFAAR